MLALTLKSTFPCSEREYDEQNPELIYDVYRSGFSFLVVSFFRARSIASRIKTSDLAKVLSELPRPKGERILADGWRTERARKDPGCFLRDFSYAL